LFTKRFLLLVVLVAILSVIAACGGAAPTPQTITVVETVVVEKEVIKEVAGEKVVETVVVEKEVEKIVEKEVAPADPNAGKVTLDTVTSSEPPSLDPALGTDSTSIFFMRQLFMGLTGFDEKANVIPSLATKWEVSEDGLTWTFDMRDDVQWVHRDPNTGEFAAVGPVTAMDVVYGVKRTLNPKTASDYAYALYMIKGAEAFNTADVAAEGFADLETNLGVTAPTTYTVQFTLEKPAAYFPSIAGMWITFPQPQATIEQYGNNWTEAGLIVTNGPYTLKEWQHGASIWLEKSPLWINAKDVQIELIGGPIIQEESTAMSMYENNEIDVMSSPPGSPVPSTDIDRVKADATLSKELFIAPQLCTYYYSFINSKPPFDNKMVRKAFSMAIDRQSLIDNVTKGGQLPAHSLTPPGNFGNMADDKTIGDYLVQPKYADQMAAAQKVLADAGYPEGEGIDIVLMHNTSEGHAQIAQAIQSMWQEAFPKAIIKIENQEWAVYLKTILPDADDAEKPNVARNGWCADYPDANNWVNDVFNSKSDSNYAKFFNDKFDKIVEDAAFEADPTKRLELYKQAETTLINEEDGIAPIYYYTYVRLYKPWITKKVVSPVSGDPISEWRIDMDMKNAAKGTK